MKKFRSLLIAIVMIFVGFAGALLVACGGNNDNMAIALSTNHLDIVLGVDDNKATLRATVTNAVDYELHAQYDSQDISVLTKYLGDGVTQVTVVAERKCKDVEVTLVGAKKSAVFTVTATLPVASIEPRSNVYSIAYNSATGGVLGLSSSMFTILPDGTDQTSLNFSLSSPIEGVSIRDNNKLVMNANLNTVPSEIGVEVVSAFDSTIKTTIRVVVVNAIDMQQVSICDEAGLELEANTTRNIARNNPLTNSLVFQVRVPFALTQSELDITPKFKFGDIGIKNNGIQARKDLANSCYVYTIELVLNPENNKVGTDQVWFELSYKDFPDSKFSTRDKENGVITITTYDEITDISITSEGTYVNYQAPLNIFTSYVATAGKPSGLALTFEAMPTTATSGQLSLNVATTEVNAGFLMVKNSAGNEVPFTNGKLLFESGETLYFSVANTGFEVGAHVSVQVLSEEKQTIQKVLTFNFNEGIITLGFVNQLGDEDDIQNSRTYYLETTGEFSSSVVKVALAPLSIDFGLATITVKGNDGEDVFEVSGEATQSEVVDNVTIYDIPISAIKAGRGTLSISFESGQKITANVVVIEKLENVSVKIDPGFNTTSVVGNLKYDENGNIEYVSLKNGQNLPLSFVGNTDILTTTFEFFDKVYNADVDDLYSEDSSYVRFGTNPTENDYEYGTISRIVSATYLRSSKIINPVAVGKVLIKSTFRGKKLELSANGKEYLYVDCEVVKYFVVEVYNPILSIKAKEVITGERNIELYAYDEIGDSNRDVTRKTVVVTLNEGGVAPTYNKILLEGVIKSETEEGLYTYSLNQAVINFTVKELGNNQFEINALTRNDNGEASLGDDEFDSAVLSFVVKDLNLEKNRLPSNIRVSMKAPVLVDKVTITNKPVDNLIYLQTRDLTQDISLTSFRILNTISPLNALNREVVYRFVPDNGVSDSIITISEDGLVRSNGQVGGHGRILVIPKDCLFLDDNGHEFFKQGYEEKLDSIEITVSDGTSRETAIRINSLSEIATKYNNNNSLHYVLMTNDTLSDGSLFTGTFSGGLYGKTLSSNNISSITLEGNSLFDTLGLDAVVEDLYIYGSVNGAGMVAQVNNGTIKNVIVDSYTTNNSTYIASSVSNQEGNAGGLVGVNNGTIDNCSFSGKVEASAIAGGLVAINNGNISSSSVLLYKLDGSEQAMTISGDIVGGLAGEIVGHSSIIKSYICDYSDTQLLPETAGGLVGKISSEEALVEKCFAERKGGTDFYAVLDEEVTEDKLTKIIKDSYVLSKSVEGEPGEETTVLTFSYYMTKITNTVLHGTTTDPVGTIYSDITFNSRNTWNKSTNKNYGFPYLTEVSAVQALTSEELADLKIQNSRLTLEEENDVAVVYLYKVKETITTSEKSVLNQLNTISIMELFNTTKTNGIMISFPQDSARQYSNLLTINANNIFVKAEGTCEINISSKYDRSIPARTVRLVIVLYTANFAITYQGQELNTTSALGIRTHSNEIIQTSIQDTLVATNRELTLELPDYKVVFEKDGQDSPYIVGDYLGNHTVLSSFDGEQLKLDVYLKLDAQDALVNKIIKDNSKINLTLNKTYGHVSLTTSISSLVVSPSDEASFTLTSVTDTKYRDVIASEYNYVVLDSNDMVVSNLIYLEQETTVNPESELYEPSKVIGNMNGAKSIVHNPANGTTTATYKIVVSINKTIKNFDKEGYTILFRSNDGTISVRVKVAILDQDILRVDINNYATIANDATSQEVAANYYPNNVLSPGTSGILDVMIYPEYATYTHITITAEPILGNSLRFTSQQKNGNRYSIDLATNFEFIENGVKIYAKDFENQFGEGQEVGRYYARVVVPSTVTVDTVFTVVVNVYNGDELKYTQEYSLVIVPQEKVGISINGETTVFALLGSTLYADVVYDQTQVISDKGVYNKRTGVVASGVSIYLLEDQEVYATKYYRQTLVIDIYGEFVNNFVVKVETSKYVNGIKQTEENTLTVYIVPFELDMETTHVVSEDSGDVAVGDRYFSHELDFVIGGKYVEGSEAGKQAYNNFLTNKYYSFGTDDGNDIGSYTINKGIHASTWIENLYFVNGSTYTPVVKKIGDSYVSTIDKTDRTRIIDDIMPQTTVVDNGDGTTTEQSTGKIAFKGLNNGTQEMLLTIKVGMPDGTTYAFNYFFTIKIADPTSDDAPKSISNAEEFIAAANGESEEDYILTRDIILYAYEVIEDTSKIRSLDGNGFQIVLVNYADLADGETSAEYALFKTVSSETTLKNLILNIYHIGTIDISDKGYDSIKVATLAIENQGIITNCQVISNRYLSNNIVPAVSGINIVASSTLGISEAKTAGFVINNTGVITNSSVGGEKIDIYSVNNFVATKKTQELAPFVISSFGEVSGFVNSNSGHIVSSYASNLRIINNSNTDYTTTTAGFAIENSGYVSMSYSKGVKNNVTDIHAIKFGIETSGISAGFVYLNSGEINNSYSNITLTNLGNNPGRNSAGFVYSNTSSGVIDTSLSLSRIIGATTTQMNFVGVDDRGNYLNNGEVNNSYYYDQIAIDDAAISIESAYGKSAQVLSSIIDKGQMYGFSFSRSLELDSIDGIWYMSSSGPELVSANTKAVSLRVASEDSDVPLYAYVDQYKYGSKYNPILIRTAQEFNKVFSGTDNSSAAKFVDASQGYIYGNYRLIHNIDLNELVDDASQDTYRLATSKMTLTGEHQKDGISLGKFDGNGFTISGLALSDTDKTNTSSNFGLFGSVENNAIVMNLNLILGTTNSEGDVFGVEAKNISYVGTVAGTVKDSTVVNINLSSVNSNSNSVVVRGKNIVGGAIGRVVGDSYVYNITAKDISVSAVMYPVDLGLSNDTDYLSYNKYSKDNRSRESLDVNVSYAGGIIGVIDRYIASDIDKDEFADSANVTDGDAVMLKTLGVNQISGGTVGGVIGYVGSLTIVQDALYELSYVEDLSTQGLYSYNGFAGGVVGLNRGYLRQVRAEHEYKWQIGNDDLEDDSIEDYIDNYYKDGPEARQSIIDNNMRGNLQLFENADYQPIGIGGLVGLQSSGKISRSYSKINVINENARFAGGAFAIHQMPVSNALNADKLTKFALEEVYAMGDVRGVVTGGVYAQSAGDSMSIEKVNAVNYWGDWLLTDTRDVYAFGANVIDESPTKATRLEKDSISFGSEEQMLANYQNQDSILQSITSLSMISGSGDDGVLFDGFFFGNEWDPESWERDENELFPHLILGYTTKVVRIRHMDDLELLRNSKVGNIYIIAPDDEYKGHTQVETEGERIVSKWIVIYKPLIWIKNFKGTIKVADSRYEYGFKFTNVPTRPLFQSAQEATFSNFTVKFDGIGSANLSSILVEEADRTTFSNLKFNNINIATTTSASELSVVVGEVKSACKFNNIEFENCSMTINTTGDNGLSAGLLFASANMNSSGSAIKGSISGIKLNDSCRVTINSSQAELKDIRVGLLGGSIIGDSETNISVDGIQGKIEINGSESASIKKSQIGYLLGNAQNITFNSSAGGKDKALQSEIIGEYNGIIQDSDIGGIVAQAGNVNFEDVFVCANISLNAVDSINLGILAGKASGSTIRNCHVYDLVDSSSATVSKPMRPAIVISNVYSGNNSSTVAIGSFVGDFGGLNSRIEGDYLDNFSYATIDLTTRTQGTDLNIGGLFGVINCTDASNASYHGNITYKSNVKNASVQQVNLGGIAGKAQGSFSEFVSTGDIRFVVYGNDIEGGSKKYYYGENVNLIIGGLFALTTGNIGIDNCLSAGNTYPYASDTSRSAEINLNTSSKVSLEKFTFGGLIGNVANSTTLKIINNYSISTLYNKFDRYIVGNNSLSTPNDGDNYKVNALVGNLDNSVNLDTSIGNKYSHVYTLVTENNERLMQKPEGFDELISENILLGNLLSNSKISALIESDSDWWEDGTKLNPNAEIKGKGDSERLNYIFLSSGVEITKGIDKLENTAIVSDGATFKLEDLDENLSQISPIAEIDADSYVAGLVIMANLDISEDSDIEKNGKKAVISGFADKNSGVIYSCNVRGAANNPANNITGSIKVGNNRIAGFVNENRGLIKACYTSMDLTSEYKDDLAVVAFVFNNYQDNNAVNTVGLIDTCYASGAIDCKKLNGETKTQKVNVFSSGNIFNSYSIAKIIHSEIYLEQLEIISTNCLLSNKNCFYDLFAVELPVSSSFKKYTKDVSLSYKQGAENPSFAIKNLNYNIEYAYGYPSFVDGIYANIEYMNHSTGNGASKETPYQVPNLGKLQQLEDLGNTDCIYFALTYDSNADRISRDIVWDSFSINQINLTSFTANGKIYEIRNLKTYGGGIFNVVTDSKINKISLNNITAKNLIGVTEDGINNYYFGILANDTVGDATTPTTIINDIYVTTSNNKERLYEGDYGQTCCLYFGSIVGRAQTGVEIKNCKVATDGANAYSLYIDPGPDNFAYYIVGGLVGLVDGAKIEKTSLTNNFVLTLIDRELSMSACETTFIVGGIVGMYKSGIVTDSYIDRSLQIFAGKDIINKQENQEDIDIVYVSNEEERGNKLVVGGIVGVVGYFSNSAPKLGIEPGNAKIDKCYVLNSRIFAGNHYFIDECYAAGISGYGGNIENCYCDAKAIAAQAMYKYFKAEPIDWYNGEPTQVSNGGKASLDYSANVYMNYGQVFNSYSKLFFMNMDQVAYASGIANYYDSINQVVNYCETIQGGMKSRNIFAYYDVDEGKLGWMVTCATSMITTAYFFGGLTLWNMAALAVFVAFPPVGWAGSAGIIAKIALFGGLCGASIANMLVIFNTTVINFDVSYFIGNGYEMFSDPGPNSSSKYSGRISYYEEFYKINEDFGLMFIPAVSKIASWLDDMFSLRTNDGMTTLIMSKSNDAREIVVGRPAFTNRGLMDYLLEDMNGLWCGLKKFTDTTAKETYIYSPSEDSGRKLLYAHDIYFDEIGYNKNGTRTIVDSNNNQIVYSSYNVIEKVNVSGDSFNDYYKLKDGDGVYESDYIPLYAIAPIIKERLNNSNYGSSDIIGNWDDWKNDGEKYVTGNTSSVSMSDIHTMLDSDHFDAETNTITVTSSDDYNAMKTIVNNLPNEVYYSSDEQQSNAKLEQFVHDYFEGDSNFDGQDSKNLKQIQEVLRHSENTDYQDAIITINFKLSSDLYLQKAYSLGTQDYPLNARITGSKNHKIKIETKVVDSTLTKQYGFVAYANNLEIDGINLEYPSDGNEIVVTDFVSDFNIGGFVATSYGKVTIKNSELQFYASDSDTSINGKEKLSVSAPNVGGFVAKANGDVEVINSLVRADILLKNEGTNNNSVGGMIGEIKGEFKHDAANKVMQNSSFRIVTNSSNDKIGGIIGWANNLKVDINYLQLNAGKELFTVGGISSKISAGILAKGKVRTGNRELYVGGLIGKLDNNAILSMENDNLFSFNFEDKILNSGSNEIDSTLIAADAGVDNMILYVGGLIGYGPTLNDESVSGENAKYSFNKVILGNKYYKSYQQRTFVEAGLNGDIYAREAYASDVIGNFSSSVKDQQTIVGQGMEIYVRSLAFANPNYKASSEVGKKPGANPSKQEAVLLDVTAIEKSVSDYVYNGDENNPNSPEDARSEKYFIATNIIKIDKYEYDLEIGTDYGSNSVAYINGEKFVLYNYNKTVFLVLSLVDFDEETSKYYISEYVYKITISGMMSKEGDYNLVENVEFNQVTAYKANVPSSSKIVDGFRKYKEMEERINGIGDDVSALSSVLDGQGGYRQSIGIYPYSYRGEDFKVTDVGDEGLKEISLITSKYQVKDNQVTLSGLDAYTRIKSDDGIMGVSRRYDAFELVNNNGEIKLDLKYSILDKNKNQLSSGIMNMFTFNSNSDFYPRLNNPKTDYIISLSSTNNEASNMKFDSYNSKFTLDKHNEAMPEIKNADMTYSIDWDNDSIIYGSSSSNNSFDDYLRVYQYPFSEVDGKNMAVVIISTMNQDEDNIYSYTDQVFATQLIGSTHKNYYLGNVKYKVYSYPLTKEQCSSRNRLFLPTCLEENQDFERYENNLLSIGDIREISTTEDYNSLLSDYIIDIVKERQYEFTDRGSRGYEILVYNEVDRYQITLNNLNWTDRQELKVEFSVENIPVEGGRVYVSDSRGDRTAYTGTISSGSKMGYAETYKTFVVNQDSFVTEDDGGLVHSIPVSVLNLSDAFVVKHKIHNSEYSDYYENYRLYIINYDDTGYIGFDMIELSAMQSDYKYIKDGNDNEQASGQTETYYLPVDNEGNIIKTNFGIEGYPQKFQDVKSVNGNRIVYFVNNGESSTLIYFNNDSNSKYLLSGRWTPEFDSDPNNNNGDKLYLNSGDNQYTLIWDATKGSYIVSSLIYETVINGVTYTQEEIYYGDSKQVKITTTSKSYSRNILSGIDLTSLDLMTGEPLYKLQEVNQMTNVVTAGYNIKNLELSLAIEEGNEQSILLDYDLDRITVLQTPVEQNTSKYSIAYVYEYETKKKYNAYLKNNGGDIELMKSNCDSFADGRIRSITFQISPDGIQGLEVLRIQGTIDNYVQLLDVDKFDSFTIRKADDSNNLFFATSDYENTTFGYNVITYNNIAFTRIYLPTKVLVNCEFEMAYNIMIKLLPFGGVGNALIITDSSNIKHYYTSTNGQKITFDSASSILSDVDYNGVIKSLGNGSKFGGSSDNPNAGKSFGISAEGNYLIYNKATFKDTETFDETGNNATINIEEYIFIRKSTLSISSISEQTYSQTEKDMENNDYTAIIKLKSRSQNGGVMIDTVSSKSEGSEDELTTQYKYYFNQNAHREYISTSNASSFNTKYLYAIQSDKGNEYVEQIGIGFNPTITHIDEQKIEIEGQDPIIIPASDEIVYERKLDIVLGFYTEG